MTTPAKTCHRCGRPVEARPPAPFARRWPDADHGRVCTACVTPAEVERKTQAWADECARYLLKLDREAAWLGLTVRIYTVRDGVRTLIETKVLG